MSIQGKRTTPTILFQLYTLVYVHSSDSNVGSLLSSRPSIPSEKRSHSSLSETVSITDASLSSKS